MVGSSSSLSGTSSFLPPSPEARRHSPLSSQHFNNCRSIETLLNAKNVSTPISNNESANTAWKSNEAFLNQCVDVLGTTVQTKETFDKTRESRKQFAQKTETQLHTTILQTKEDYDKTAMRAALMALYEKPQSKTLEPSTYGMGLGLGPSVWGEQAVEQFKDDVLVANLTRNCREKIENKAVVQNTDKTASPTYGSIARNLEIQDVKRKGYELSIKAFWRYDKKNVDQVPTLENYDNHWKDTSFNTYIQNLKTEIGWLSTQKENEKLPLIENFAKNIAVFNETDQEIILKLLENDLNRANGLKAALTQALAKVNGKREENPVMVTVEEIATLKKDVAALTLINTLNDYFEHFKVKVKDEDEKQLRPKPALTFNKVKTVREALTAAEQAGVQLDHVVKRDEIKKILAYFEKVNIAYGDLANALKEVGAPLANQEDLVSKGDLRGLVDQPLQANGSASLRAGVQNAIDAIPLEKFTELQTLKARVDELNSLFNNQNYLDALSEALEVRINMLQKLNQFNQQLDQFLATCNTYANGFESQYSQNALDITRQNLMDIGDINLRQEKFQSLENFQQALQALTEQQLPDLVVPDLLQNDETVGQQVQKANEIAKVIFEFIKELGHQKQARQELAQKAFMITYDNQPQAKLSEDLSNILNYIEAIRTFATNDLQNAIQFFNNFNLYLIENVPKDQGERNTKFGNDYGEKVGELKQTVAQKLLELQRIEQEQKDAATKIQSVIRKKLARIQFTKEKALNQFNQQLNDRITLLNQYGKTVENQDFSQENLNGVNVGQIKLRDNIGNLQQALIHLNNENAPNIQPNALVPNSEALAQKANHIKAKLIELIQAEQLRIQAEQLRIQAEQLRIQEKAQALDGYQQALLDTLKIYLEKDQPAHFNLDTAPNDLQLQHLKQNQLQQAADLNLENLVNAVPVPQGLDQNEEATTAKANANALALARKERSDWGRGRWVAQQRPAFA